MGLRTRAQAPSRSVLLLPSLLQVCLVSGSKNTPQHCSVVWAWPIKMLYVLTSCPPAGIVDGMYKTSKTMPHQTVHGFMSIHAKSLRLCLTLCNPMDYIARQAPLFMRFSRQEYWSGLSCPPPKDLPDPGIEPTSLMSPALAGRFFTTNATWEGLKGALGKYINGHLLITDINLMMEQRDWKGRRWNKWIQ